MKNSYASAIWKGNLKEGNGEIKLHSIGYKTPYTFASRFENAKGTNPEELIGAAHAACFSMALSHLMTEQGYEPGEINTTATVTMENKNGKSAIIGVHLDTMAKAEGLNNVTFLKLAVDAKKNCPVSQALKTLKISLNAKLV